MAQQTNLIQGPEAVETAELHFKLHCRLKVFETSSKYEEGHCCILAVSQCYGLIFVGNLNGFSVISTKSLNAGISPDEFPRRNIVLNVRPSHISVDNSQKILAVACNSKSGSLVLFYNIQSFALKDVTPFKVTSVSKLVQNSTAEIVDLIWQPNAEGSFVLCMSDGSVIALPQGTKDDTMFALPSTTQAMCFCWSPKGKQIVIGSAVGTLSQYKPDLKLVKTLPAPPLFNGNVMVVSVLWISSFQFAVAYNDRANPESFPVITIVNAAKNEPVSVINYDDITYSSTLFRNHQIYMTHQTAWNLIFVSSANSIEIAVLHMKDTSSWEQWLLGDASRAELPLNPDRQETFPLGWAFDYTSQEAIPWGEGSLPPMPRLLLVSDEGLLCVFNVVNAAGDAPQLCAPPKENFDDSLFTVTAKTAPPATSDAPPNAPANVPSNTAPNAAPNVAPNVPPNATPAAKGILGSPPTFGTAKPTFSFQSSPVFGGFGTKPQAAKTPQDASPSLQQQPEQPQTPKQPQQQQQQQPPVQIPQQPQVVQQVVPTLPVQSESSPAPFKLSVPQFGTAPAFTFGGGSNVIFASKPATTEKAKVAEPAAAGSFALQTSASQKSIFSGKTLPQSTPIKQPEVHIPDKTTAPLPAVKKPEEVESTPKTEDLVAKGESGGPATPELPSVDDSVYLSAMQEEIDHFNSELQQLNARVGNLDIQLGTEEDKSRMKTSIDRLYSFWKELKETTEGQNSEIHAVVMDLMEAFAWLEDAKSRNLQRKNPSYIELKKSEELDPLNARHMEEISHLKYYIVNQLKQLTGHLEKEWMDHQESHRNEVKSKMAVPPLEEVYKTMHYQLKILHKQKTLLEELKAIIAMRKRRNKPQFIISSASPTAQSNNTTGNRASELSKLAENLLQLKINREEESVKTGAWELMKSQLTAISERSKKLTRDKQTALRDALSERDMVRIRPVKTTLESSSFLRSLHLEKTKQKTPKPRPFVRHDDRKETPESKPDAGNPEENPVAAVAKADASKVSVEKTPVVVQTLPRPEDKSPLASLTGIVSSIGVKKNDNAAFVFGSPSIQKPEQKQEEQKTTQPFTFGAGNPFEIVFGKKDPIVFNAKPNFNLPSSITVVATKPQVIRQWSVTTLSVTVTSVTTTKTTTAPATVPVPFCFSFSAPATTTPASTSSSSFSFTPATTTVSTALPKVSLFDGKESTFGTPATTERLFSTTTIPATTSASTSIFGNSCIFGGSKTTTATTTASSFVFSKPSTDTQSSGFALVQTSDSKSTAPTNDSAQAPVSSEAEEVDVVTVDEPANKTESVLEKAKESPKAAPATTTASSATSKSTLEVASTTANVTDVSTAVSTPTTKSVTTANETPAVVATTVSVASSTTAATTGSVFSFSSVTAPGLFGQTSTTSTATTTTSFFGTPTTTTTSLFGQVSSTTPPTTNIFGGSNSTPTAAPIFGTSTPVKTATDQPTTPSTVSESIFGASTPTTNSFGQVSTPLSAAGTPSGQKPDTVDQTANLFGQMLSSESNKSTFEGGVAPATSANLFTPQKSIFEPTTTTTGSVFGSGFGRSLFGQPTTTANVFGSQTTTSSSFFGGGTYNAFGKSTTAGTNQSPFKSGGFSEPVFGQSVFGMSFKNNSNAPAFGGSIFGGSPSSTTGNVFQTPTTSSSFGTAAPGPFSGGASSFGESAFGSSPTFQKPLGGFASPPVFGGGPGGAAPAPAFGGSPTFGGSPSFGSLPTFGSVSQGGFGQTSGSTTFENLANQNTVGFGNLAQQTQSQGFGGGFGGSTFENKPAFGGNSFSSWRSK